MHGLKYYPVDFGSLLDLLSMFVCFDSETTVDKKHLMTVKKEQQLRQLCNSMV